MAVTDTIAAFVASGFGGPVRHWRTEVVHPLDGRRRVIPDAVLYAPGIAVPLLTVEVDRDTMGAQRVAAKLPAYVEYYQRRTKTPIDGTHQVWRQTYSGADSPEGSYPPLALVLVDVTAARARTWTDEFAALTRLHWPGTRADHEGAGPSATGALFRSWSPRCPNCSPPALPRRCGTAWATPFSNASLWVCRIGDPAGNEFCVEASDADHVAVLERERAAAQEQ